MSEPDTVPEALRDYERRVQDIAARAQDAQRRVESVRPSVTSADGAVTVTVSAAGALEGLSFGTRAEEIGLVELADLVVATSTAARHEAARLTQEAVADLIGDTGPAMDFLRAQVPGGDATPVRDTAARRGEFGGEL